MKLLRYIKSLFGIYEIGHAYTVPLDKIKITPEFARTRIIDEKWYRKLTYFEKLGRFESKIIIKKDFTLVDGYSSYKIGKMAGLKKVMVCFVD